MRNLRMEVGIQMEEERELSTLLKNGSAVDEDEIRENGLTIVSADQMRRRLQSHTARERNRVDHVSVLYRNCPK